MTDGPHHHRQGNFLWEMEIPGDQYPPSTSQAEVKRAREEVCILRECYLSLYTHVICSRKSVLNAHFTRFNKKQL